MATFNVQVRLDNDKFVVLFDWINVISMKNLHVLLRISSYGEYYTSEISRDSTQGL
jgi:hypothetical protein